MGSKGRKDKKTRTSGSGKSKIRGADHELQEAEEIRRAALQALQESRARKGKMVATAVENHHRSMLSDDDDDGGYVSGESVSADECGGDYGISSSYFALDRSNLLSEEEEEGNSDDDSDDDDHDDEVLQGKKLLSLASMDGRHQNVKRLLDRKKGLIRTKNTDGDTALHVAARNGHIDTVKELVRFITKGPRAISVSEPNKDGDTPLHLALEDEQHQEVASYLIKKQPDAAYEVNHAGISPLFLAVKGNHAQFVEKLFKLLPGIKMRETTIKKLLRPEAPLAHMAIKAKNIAMLRVLLDNIRSLVNSKNETGWKPISYAAYKGYCDIVSYFLMEFPNCAKERDADGSFPIHKAASGGHIDVLEEFLSRSPTMIYERTTERHTILHVALKYNRKKVVRHLKKQHAPELKEMLGNKTIEDLAHELNG